MYLCNTNSGMMRPPMSQYSFFVLEGFSNNYLVKNDNKVRNVKFKEHELKNLRIYAKVRRTLNLKCS